MTNILAIVFIVLAAWMAVLAYSSPDPSSCFYVLGLDKVHATVDQVKKLAGKKNIAVRKGYPIDMANVYRIFFMWGFWNICAEFLIIAAAAIMYCWKPSVAIYQFFSFTAFVIASSLFHFFLGLSWRFSSAGKVVSGDMLENKASEMSESEWQTML